MSNSKNSIQPTIAFTTLLRMQNMTNKPIRRGFDTVLNELLTELEELKKAN